MNAVKRPRPLSRPPCLLPLPPPSASLPSTRPAMFSFSSTPLRFKSPFKKDTSNCRSRSSRRSLFRFSLGSKSPPSVLDAARPSPMLELFHRSMYTASCPTGTNPDDDDRWIFGQEVVLDIRAPGPSTPFIPSDKLPVIGNSYDEDVDLAPDEVADENGFVPDADIEGLSQEIDNMLEDFLREHASDVRTLSQSYYEPPTLPLPPLPSPLPSPEFFFPAVPHAPAHSVSCPADIGRGSVRSKSNATLPAFGERWELEALLPREKRNSDPEGVLGTMCAELWVSSSLDSEWAKLCCVGQPT
ncbi:hypothetical protein OF83DRAFT_189941 [Amylostereum chailletii]|nr:hypothetical protein OF83DRAFT_189941 [Amylostereum chailletii]